jgi:Flp pilus assembly protein CpaB
MKLKALLGGLLVLLIGTVFVVWQFFSQPRNDAVPVAPVARPKVLVARFNMFEGLAVARVDEVEVREVTDDEMEDYLRNKHQYMPPMREAAVFRVLARNVAANEPLLKEYFQDLIQPDPITISVTVPVELSVSRDRNAGVFRPNDLVDVLLTVELCADPDCETTKTALIVPALRMRRKDSIWELLKKDPGGDLSKLTVVLEASENIKGSLLFAQQRGRLSLAHTAKRLAPQPIPTDRVITEADLEELFGAKLAPLRKD